MFGWLEDLISLITSPEIQRDLLPAKLVFIFFAVVFFVAVVYFMLASSYLKYQSFTDLQEFFVLQPAGMRKIVKKWKVIQRRIDTGIESEHKLAIIEAEELLNDILENKGFGGKDFEERIKQVEKIQLPNLDEVLEAHKTRNAIVYEPDYKLNRDQAKKVLDIYEKAIRSVESF